MDTYKEYPIRCKSCNEQLACYAPDYEALLEAGSTEEQSLNELGIMAYCSRIAMMNPTIVSFNMENREVIEGFKSVDAANEADAQNESITRPVFNPCMGAGGGVIPTVRPVLAAPALTPARPEPIRTLPNAPGIVQPTTQLTIRPTTGAAAPGIFGQGMPVIRPGLPMRITPQVTIPAVINAPQPVPEILSPTIVAPIVTGIELGTEIEALGVGIPVELPAGATNKFEEPVAVGVPTINPDPTVQQALIYVGAGKHVRVLNGRTYLAQ